MQFPIETWQHGNATTCIVPNAVDVEIITGNERW
jgi:hypothetical protein